MRRPPISDERIQQSADRRDYQKRKSLSLGWHEQPEVDFIFCNGCRDEAASLVFLDAAMKSEKSNDEVVVIDWLDSFTSSGWEGADAAAPYEIHSVGLMVRESDASVTISTSKSRTGQYMDQLTIPRVAITSIKKL